MRDEVKAFKKGKHSFHPSSLIPHPFFVALAPHLRFAFVALTRQGAGRSRSLKLTAGLLQNVLTGESNGEGKRQGFGANRP
jgi:hypothetical protein